MYPNPLHRARIGAGITLAELTARTCLSPRIVQLMDCGQFDRLPGGLYARSYVRAYASIVGLDPEAVVRELTDRLPPDVDPLPALRENARADLPPLVKDLAQWCDAAKSALVPSSLHVWRSALPAPLQLRRFAASGIDLTILLLCYAALIRVTTLIAGVDARTGFELAGVPAAGVSGLVGLLYFLLLGGIGGRTAGALVFRLPVSSAPVRLGLRDILLRALPLSDGVNSVTHSEWNRERQHLDPADSTV